ncbi:hypothetical protein [Kineococcus sp. SYSU DK003]|uniref:hypothetical protein n=1 Tax=Kineococcus sp. SYSU DK003 TaxID=3383124 RepID=UPI003D7E8389
MNDTIDPDGTGEPERPSQAAHLEARDAADELEDAAIAAAPISPAAQERLAQATALLRQHTDSGWKAMQASVIARALAAFRPSAPVRGRHESGDFLVASDVLVARLRQVVDAVPQAAAQRITCATGARDELESVTIQLIAGYGAVLTDLAARVHTEALDCLHELLGPLAPTAEQVHTHVHIGDVSDDPRTFT